MNKMFYVIAAIMCASILSSCETTTRAAGGAAQGLHNDITNTATNTSNAAKSSWHAVEKTDAWMQDHWW